MDENLLALKRWRLLLGGVLGPVVEVMKHFAGSPPECGMMVIEGGFCLSEGGER